MAIEIEITPKNPDFVLNLAKHFLGELLPNNPENLKKALDALKQQHENVKPRVNDRNYLVSLIASQHPSIPEAQQTAESALNRGNYELALYSANYLFALAEIQFLDSLDRGQALELALSLHRSMANRIKASFASSDPYLLKYGEQIFRDAQLSSQNDDKEAQFRELIILREAIHMTVINGTLGEPIKEDFDPKALVRYPNSIIF